MAPGAQGRDWSSAKSPGPCSLLVLMNIWAAQYLEVRSPISTLCLAGEEPTCVASGRVTQSQGHSQKKGMVKQA